MTTHDHITIALEKDKLQFDDLNRLIYIPVTIPYKGFQVIVSVYPERSIGFGARVPSHANLKVLDMRDSAPLNKYVTSNIFSPECFVNGSLSATSANIQKAFSWIDREVKLDAIVPKDLNMELTYEQKLMVLDIGSRVRTMLPNLCKHWLANWDTFQVDAGCSKLDGRNYPTRVIDAMYHLSSFQGVWFASRFYVEDKIIRDWLFVYLLGETEQYRVESGWSHRSIPLDKSKGMLQFRWVEKVINQREELNSIFQMTIHKALDSLPEFKST